jgi:ATP-binding protein involved in chromosome partitioning
MASRDEVMAALANIPGPDGKTPLPESGAISGLTIRDGKVFLAIVVDPDRAKALEPMRARAEAAIRAAPGVANAVVTLTAEAARAIGGPAPGHGHAHEHGGGEQRRQAHGGRSSAPIPGVRHIIAVASGKGGVGKSTVACNLAVGLAKLGLKVGVLDADLFGPSMPRLFGLAAKPDLAPDGKMLVPLEAYGVRVMSIGFLIDEGAPVIWRGPMVMSALTQLLREVDWGALDVLVVDMPPGTGDTQLTMAQNVPLSGAVIVSTPQDLALIDARRGIAMFKQVHVPLIGVVENMSYFLCPHCGGRTDVFSHAGAQREAEKLGVPFLGEVPLDIAIRANSDDGRPVVTSLPDSAHAGAFLEIARRVAQTLEVGAPGAKPAPRIRVV